MLEGLLQTTFRDNCTPFVLVVGITLLPQDQEISWFWISAQLRAGIVGPRRFVISFMEAQRVALESEMPYVLSRALMLDR
jgi:hypothetical protein